MSGQPNIAIAGVAGRMGRELARAALRHNLGISGGTERSDSVDIGTTIGALIGDPSLASRVSDQVPAAANGASIWVDFTAPSATLTALDQLQRTSVNSVIIGTTGFSDADLDRVERYAERFAIVKAGNFSLGINLLEHLVQLAAARLGEAWDIEVSETHHHHKKDAPSGTALMLGEAAAKGRDKPLEALRADPYDGPEAAREPGEIGFSVQRIGGVIGDHSVSFGTQQEVITLSHRAIDRAVFAHGAIRAAQWAHSQAPGLYNLGDVLGL